MCGRFTLTIDLKEIIENYGFEISYVSQIASNYTPRFNIAPSQAVLAIAAGQKQNRLGYINWGLKAFPKGSPIINARAETLREKKSFAKLVDQRRCLILADGFFEWKKTHQGKEPYYIYLQGKKFFSMAALWNRWKQNGEEYTGCVIITQQAPNYSNLTEIHSRMPLLLTEQGEKEWLYSSNIVLSEIVSESQALMTQKADWHKVSTAVNSYKNDFPEVVEPVS
ncbi:SOS response-associated peptidase [Natranaerobius thermophilus]|uniref:Abasic site processing protein n=1 Tax=Natranaerobius thermophilus (strain ATCC BAA-1301 / DSM 18059 / JW/NM-WN-LF) TaxID=457570 RepID=B2A6E8_NATTJ|nr:SOS response-associated peptidase [Natranaerobius thermophilus]ACB84162.1 protein of unknown function DUF159 [Natranaerobius thermophilus JW/NM-WN-LF]